MQLGPVVPAEGAPPHLGIAGAAVYAIFFAAVVFATRRRAVYAIVALVAVDPFALSQAVGPTTLTLSKIALAAAVAGLALRRSSVRPLGEPAAWLIAAVLAVAAGMALSIAHAAFSGPAIRETLKWIEYAAIIAVCAVAFRDDPDESLIRWALLIITAAVIALSIPEIYLGAHSGFEFAHSEIPRIAGPLEGPNQLAAYLGITLPAILAYTLLAGRRWLEIFVVTAGIVATLLTFSRGGIVALAFGLLLVACFCAASRAAKIAFGAAALAVLAAAAFAWRVVAGGIGLVASAPHHRIEIHGGLGTRRDLWHAALQLWNAHRFWGIGAGNYELLVGKFLHAPIKTHANSFYLQSLVEGGLPSIAAAVFLVCASILTFVRNARAPLTVAALCASAALAIHFVLDLLVFYPKVGGMWMILLGLAAAQVARQRSERVVQPRSQFISG